MKPSPVIPLVASLLLVGCAYRQDSLSPSESNKAAAPLPPVSTKAFVLCDLGTLGGLTASPRDVNNLGQVVGVSQIANGSFRAFLWQNGRMANLGDSVTIDDADDGHGGSIAYAISENGILMGSRLDAKAVKRLGLRDAGTLVPKGFRPDAVSQAGMIVAREVPVAGRITKGSAFRLRTTDGAVQPLVLPPGRVRTVTAVNDRKQMVVFLNAKGDRYAIWDGPVLSDLGPKVGYPEAISNREVVVGSYSERAAVLWPPDKRQTLPALPGLPATGPRDVNEAGVIVGSAAPSSSLGYPSPDHRRAVRWKGGKAEDLNKYLPRNCGWVLTEAIAINDHGWIVGDGEYNGRKRGFLLKPVVAEARSQV